MANGHPQSGLQLGHAEGLGDEVVGATVERLDLAPLVAVGREHHDRHVGELPDPSADLQPVHVGQAQVQDDQIGVDTGPPG